MRPLPQTDGADAAVLGGAAPPRAARAALRRLRHASLSGERSCAHCRSDESAWVAVAPTRHARDLVRVPPAVFRRLAECPTP